MPEQDSYFENNPLLDKIEEGKPYNKTRKFIEKSLEAQWDDVLTSGLLNDLYNDFPVKEQSVTKQEIPTTNEATPREEIGISTGDVVVSAALIAYLTSRVAINLKSIRTYSDFPSKLKGYLKHIGDISGQSVLDTVDLPKKLKFRLSKQEYKDQIQNRVDSLVTNMDQTTKNRLVRNIALGIENGTRKSVLTKELQQLGERFAGNRARVIIHTETQAASEFIRHETARLNGVQEKEWATVGDNKVSAICQSLSGQRKLIKEDFEGDIFSGPHPPAHVNCRSWIEYVINQDAWRVFSKALTEHHEDIVEKAEDKFSYQDSTDEAVPVFNPNAVWAGGESLVGKDKKVGVFVPDIRNQYDWKEKVKDALKITGKIMWIESEEFFARNNVEQWLHEARNELTDAGFIQVILALGLRRKIYSKEK